MISNYEIRKINNEEVLFLFIDYSTEFASMRQDRKKTTIKKEVDDYIKKEKIKFGGKRIVLMASGLIIGTCLLKAPMKQNYEDINYNYTTNILTLNDEIKTDEELEEVIKQVTDQDEVKNAESNTNSDKETRPATNNTGTNKKPTTSTPSKKPASSSPSTPSKVPSTSTPVITPPVSKPTETKPAETKPEVKPTPAPSETVKEDVMVAVKRSNGTVLNIGLEEYLIGVVGAEMPASFNIEALKAQAIAARTYALKAREENRTLTDTVSTQVYKDNNQLKAAWGSGFNTYYEKVKKAVMDTKGLVMYYNGSLINAYYHSTSNGKTEDSSFVFGEFPYLKSVNSEVDQAVSSYLRSVTFNYQEISNKLGVPVTALSNIVIERNNSGRVKTIIIDNNSYDGVKFRMTLGLRSTDFDINLNEDNITITTRGYGHGVGMSQYGANEYAKKGYSYEKILKHYYTGITIRKY